MAIFYGIAERVCAILTGHSLKKWLRFGAKIFSVLATLLIFIPPTFALSLIKEEPGSVYTIPPAPTYAFTSRVGATPGQFRVSESGAANYSIAIATPPGTAGMQPSLSLTYSSQGSNGLLGMGWGLGGLSVIYRCPKTIAQDGSAGGVNLDANDRFCFEGQRLVAINGSYGGVGTEYRTETESFSRIVSYGTQGTGPAYWKVWTKSGQIMEFGLTSDSLIEAQGKTEAMLWALNKVSDTAGNYLTVTYIEDNTNGQYYPARIDYAGNTNTAKAPHNSVQFFYEPRPDIVPTYVAGALVRSTVRMTHIKTYAGTTLTHDYGLAYEQGVATGRSRVAALTQCAANGAGLDCLPATTFAWQEGQVASFASTVESPAMTGTTADTWFSMGDVNADGRTDLVAFNTSKDMRVYTSDGIGLVQTQQFISPFISASAAAFNPGEWRFFMDDLNGDGYAEPLACGVGGYIDFSLNKGWGVLPWATQPQGNAQATIAMQASKAIYLGYQPYNVLTWKQWCMSSVSSDGKGDVAWYATEYWKGIELFKGVKSNATYDTVTFTQEGASVPLSNADSSIAQSADIDGDGNGDMIRFDPASGALFTWLQRNNAYGAVTTSQLDAGGNPSSIWFSAADVNGDGLGDMVLHDPVTGSLKVWLSKGNGTVAAKVETLAFDSGGTPADTWFELVDVNGDGFPDAIKYRPATGDMKIALAKGDGSFGLPQPLATMGTGPQPTLGLGPKPTSGWFQPADINGDGIADLVRYDPTAGKIKVNLGQGAVPDRLLVVTNGLGATTRVTYKPLTDASVYTKGTGAVYPYQDLQAPMYVVSNVTRSDGIGGDYVTDYSYSGARSHHQGGGFLGFQQVTTHDPQAALKTTTTFRQDYPYHGMPLTSVKQTDAGVVLNQTSNTYTDIRLNTSASPVYHQSLLTQSVETSYELNGSLVTTVTTTKPQHDAYGNPTQIVVSTGDGYTKTTTNTYTNDVTNWLLGRLTLTTVTSVTPTAGSLTRTSSFAYNATNGLLTQEVIEPNNVALRLQTDYTYDGYGNKLSVTVSGSGIITRTTSTIFDARGQFPIKTTNALGHSDISAYDARFGKAFGLTGPNNLTTTWSYDGFGRKINETRADATQTNVAYNLCDATCPNYAKYYVSSTTLGSPTSYAYYDMLNREIRVQTQGFDGRLITKDTYYDSFGRVDRVTKPYYAGDSPLYSYLQYDPLGRVIQETAPDNSTKQIAYNGLTTTVTNALSQRETKTKNSQGQLVSVTDNLGSVISYQYDPFGNLTKTTDPKGNQTTLTYDARGRKIGMIDPDMGSWTYTYNVLGELIQQKDAKLQIVNMTYDVLGRMLTRSEPDLVSTWVFDTSPKGIGKLATVKSDNGFFRSYGYDNFGRAISETSFIDATYTVSKTYDTYGRVSVLTYPGSFSARLAVKNIYNAYGYLSEVRSNAGALFWKANAKDADGNVLSETLGNGLTTTRTYTASTGRVQAIKTNGVAVIQNQSFTFDSLGNLSARFDSVAGFTETFGYDDLNRLITATQGAVTTTVAYDSIGNIASKSDVGTYTYGTRPHAVTQVTGILNASYTYDTNGNLTSGAGRTVTLTSYNLPSQITQGANSVNFIYDAEHARIKQTSASGTTIYLSPRIDAGIHFEKEVKGGVTENKHYIYGAAGVVGIYTTRREVTPVSRIDITPKTSYFHRDHLGSIVAVTNDTALVTARYKYDAWGKRIVTVGDADATHHGFTGHEHLDDVGLVHMNGRVYDPILGKFMSADPYIQSPDNLQSYNRYSYVWNNPLTATDPSGYFSLKEAWRGIRGAVKAAVGIYLSATGNSAGPALIQSGFNDLNKKPALSGVGVNVALYQAGFDTNGQKTSSCVTLSCGGGVGFSVPSAATERRGQLNFSAAMNHTAGGASAGMGASGGVGLQGNYGVSFGEWESGYLFNCVAHECWKQGALGAVKAVGGGLTVATGAAICTSLAGCALGAPMAAFGASDAWQGGGMVVDAAQGISSEGFNLIKSGFKLAMPEWGGVAYEGLSLSFNLGALGAKVPAIIGPSGGIERASSLFGVSATRWNNAAEKFGVFLSKPVNQMMLTGSAIGKAFGVGVEVNNVGGP